MGEGMGEGMGRGGGRGGGGGGGYGRLEERQQLKLLRGNKGAKAGPPRSFSPLCRANDGLPTFSTIILEFLIRRSARFNNRSLRRVTLLVNRDYRETWLVVFLYPSRELRSSSAGKVEEDK
jgi:hypothetical protein